MRCFVTVGLATLLIPLFSFAVGAVVQTAQGQASGAPDQALKLWQQYRSIHSIHCEATETEEIPGTSIPTAHGTYEYWADGDKFKIADLWNPAERPEVANEFYWDGKQFVDFVPGGNAPNRSYQKCQESGPSASVWKHVDNAGLLRLTPAVEPVPLAPFVFLSPGGNDLGHRPTLEQIRSDATRLALRQLHWIGKDVAAFPTGPYPNLAVAHSDHEPPEAWITQKYYVRFGGNPSFLPTDIRSVFSTGAIVERYEITYMTIHTKTGDFYMPSVVKDTSCAPFAPKPNIGVFTFTVKRIEINIPIPPDTFTFDLRKVQHVIDLDQQSPTSRPSTRSDG